MNTTTRTYPRTMRQAEANPMAWWESAEDAAANESHIKAMFDGADERMQGEGINSRWFYLALYSLGLFAVLAAVGQYFGFNFAGWPG